MDTRKIARRRKRIKLKYNGEDRMIHQQIFATDPGGFEGDCLGRSFRRRLVLGAVIPQQIEAASMTQDSKSDDSTNGISLSVLEAHR